MRLGLPKKPKSSNDTAREGVHEAIFQPEFREDLRWWIETYRRVTLRVIDIVEAVMHDPFSGIGKPEPLTYIGAGVWSRRITQQHRLVYRMSDTRINYLQARYHY